MLQFTVIANEGIFINYRRLTKDVKKTLLSQVKDIAIDCLREFASSKNWKTIGENVRFKMSENQVSVFPSPKKEKLIGWLHFGTPDHFVKPKTARALCWVPSGGSNAVDWLSSGASLAYSKGHNVRGIKAMNFFTVTPIMAERINKLIETINQG